MTADNACPPAWWTIREDALIYMLQQVAAGEDPHVVLMEQYVNSDHEDCR